VRTSPANGARDYGVTNGPSSSTMGLAGAMMEGTAMEAMLARVKDADPPGVRHSSSSCGFGRADPRVLVWLALGFLAVGLGPARAQPHPSTAEAGPAADDARSGDAPLRDAASAAAPSGDVPRPDAPSGDAPAGVVPPGDGPSGAVAAPPPDQTLPAAGSEPDPLRTPGGRSQKKFLQTLATFEKLSGDIAKRSLCLEELKGIRPAYHRYACYHTLRGDIFAAGGLESEAFSAYQEAIDLEYYCAPALLRMAEISVNRLMRTRKRSSLDVSRTKEHLARAVWMLNPSTRDVEAQAEPAARMAAQIIARSAEAWGRDYAGFRQRPEFDFQLYRFHEASYYQALLFSLLALSDTDPDERQLHRERAYESTSRVVAAVKNFPDHTLDRARLLHILTSFESGRLSEAASSAADLMLDERYAALRIPPETFRDGVFVEAVALGNEPLALDRLEGTLLQYSEVERLRFVAQNALTYLRLGRDLAGDPLTASPLGEVLTRYAYDIAEVRDEAGGTMSEFVPSGGHRTDPHLARLRGGATWRPEDLMDPSNLRMQEQLPEDLQGRPLNVLEAREALAALKRQRPIEITSARTSVVLASGAVLDFDEFGRPANGETRDFVERTRVGNLVQKGAPTLEGMRPDIRVQIVQEGVIEGSPRAAVIVQVEEWSPAAFRRAAINLRVLDSEGRDVFRPAREDRGGAIRFSPGGEASVLDGDTTALARTQNRRYYTRAVGLSEPAIRPGQRYTASVQVNDVGSRATWATDQSFEFAPRGAAENVRAPGKRDPEKAGLRLSDIVVGHPGTAGDQPVLQAVLPDSQGSIPFRVLPNPGARFHGEAGGDLTFDFSVLGIGTIAYEGGRRAVVEKTITIVPLEYEGGAERTRRIRPNTPELSVYGKEGTTFARCTLTSSNYLSTTSTLEQAVGGSADKITVRFPTTIDISALIPGKYVCTISVLDHSEDPHPRASGKFIFEKLPD